MVDGEEVSFYDELEQEIIDQLTNLSADLYLPPNQFTHMNFPDVSI